jgi:hypothetical protein
MRIIINESQYKVLLEQVEGLDTFKTKTLQSYPEVEEYWDIIEEFIRSSDAKKIEINNLKMGIAVSLLNGIIFSEGVFKQPLPLFLFTVFHEFAHQHQFRKYGKEKMMELYTDKISNEEGAKIMREIELVADEFAIRKLRELQKYGHLQNMVLPRGFYKNTPMESFVAMVKHLKSHIKDMGLKTPEEISNVFYNWLKVKNQN